MNHVDCARRKNVWALENHIMSEVCRPQRSVSRSQQSAEQTRQTEWPAAPGQRIALYQFPVKETISQIFVAASHQTRLDTRSKARRPIKVGIKGRGRSGTSRDSNPACLCCSSAHLVQCEPDEASSFTNPNVGPGTYASLRLKLDAWSSAVQRGQKCSSPTRRLPSRSWGPIRPRVCSWFRAPIRHECQTAQPLQSLSFSLKQQFRPFHSK